MAEKKLRESFNNVTLEGYLNSKDFKTGTTRNGKVYISGKLEIRQDDTSMVEVEVFATETNSKGEPNKVYKSLTTVMEKYKDATMVEGVNPETAYKQADKIRVTGGRVVASEWVKEDDVLTAIKYNTSFVNRVEDDTFSPKAKFKLEVYVTKLQEELVNDEETGRGFIDGVFIGYDGLPKPVRFVAEGKTWKQIEQKISEHETVIFWGDIVNTVVERNFTTEADIGEDDERVITSTKKERIIRGAKINEENAYEDKEMKKAFKALAEHYEQLKEDSVVQGEGSKSNKVANNSSDNDNEDDGVLPWEKK